MAQILIVEDDLTTNNLVSDYLTDAGHTMFSAYDGLEALKYFQQEFIELIILDIMLPKMNGLQVLKEIRETRNIPVLMLTALGDERTQIASFDSLADDYITKPFSMVLLGKRVLALLRRAGKMGEKDIWKRGTVSVDFSGYVAEKKRRTYRTGSERDTTVKAACRKRRKGHDTGKADRRRLGDRRTALRSNDRHLYPQDTPKAGLELYYNSEGRRLSF